jgi:hypothetical protein
VCDLLLLVSSSVALIWILERGGVQELELCRVEMKESIDLVSEAPVVVALLDPYFALLKDDAISECDMVGLFILTYLALRRPRNWCSTTTKESFGDVSSSSSTSSMRLCALDEPLQRHLNIEYISRKLKHKHIDQTLQETRVVDLFNSLCFSGVKHNSDQYINRFMVQWFRHNRPVRLLSHIPSPLEVLSQQAAGERVVTMFRTELELSRAHRSKLTYMSGSQEHCRDPLEFLLHDLRHMEHFCDLDSHDEQVGFFFAVSQLNGGQVRKYFLDILGYNKALWFELEYVVSDMNCYVSHLLRYLHAKWYAACCAKFEKARCCSTAAPPDDDVEGLEELLNKEWTALMRQLFDIPLYSMQDTVALDAACRLNEVTLMHIAELPTQDWLCIRDWFILVGQRRRLELSAQSQGL